MIAQRILAILSATLLVGAVAVAMLGPPAVPLGQMLLMLDHDLMAALRAGAQKLLGAWFWDDLVVPLLLRPAWLVPAALGLVFAGLSLSLATRKPAERSHRRS